jgi:F-type H+-transporting ATPase subunit delta
MAELTTIARPYAEAAFALAREQDALPLWSRMLQLASAVVADPKVAEALDSPRLDAAAKESLLLSICGDQLTAEGRNFLRVLIGADRIKLLPAIYAMFESLKDAASGLAKATVETAFPLSDRDLTDLTASLERRFGKKIEATVTVNQELIGGVRVVVGDTVIDGSVQEQLRAMAAQLRA